MPLVLSQNPALLSLSPLAEEVDANKPPVINTYSPEVESWRREVWDLMPPQLKARPDAATLLDKNLYVLSGESSGNDKAVGDGGAAWGGYQDHHIPAGSDRTTQIKSAWGHISKNPDQWTDWGEDTTYNGQVFGALGNKPYNGGSSGSTAGASIGQQFQQTQSTPNLRGINPNQGGFRDAQYNPANVEPGTNANTLGPVGAVADWATTGIPALETAKDQLGTGLDKLGANNLIGLPNIKMGGGGAVSTGGSALPIGEAIAEQFPTTPLGVGLTAAPFAGNIKAGAEAAGTRVAPKLRLVTKDFIPETTGFHAGIPTSGGNLQNEVKLATARKQYQDLIAQGFTDEQIAATFGQQAVDMGKSGIDTTAQNTARLNQEQAAKSAAASRTTNRLKAEQGIESTAPPEIQTEARRAAALAPEKLPEQKPNVLYSEQTAAEMAAASPRKPVERIGTGEDIPVPEETTRLYRGEQPFDKTIPDPPWGSDRGRSFTDDLIRAQKYAQDGGRIRYVDIPNSDLATWEHKPSTDRYLAPDDYRQKPGLQWGDTGQTRPNEPPTNSYHSGLPVSPPEHWNVLNEALGALGVPQTVMASADIGQIGRQAQVLGWSNPKEYLDSVRQGIKAYASEKATQVADAAVRASPAYEFAKESGLHFYQVGEGVTAGERVPGFGGLGGNSRISRALEQLGPVKASERSLATTLNVQGMQVFEKYGDAMVRAGITDQKQFDALARVINHARGYGTGSLADMTASSNAFFSARNMISRFQVLLDPVMTEGSLFQPSARQLAAKNLAAFITGQTALMGFLGVTGALAGGAWSVNADPRSGDFGQLHIGNTHLDTLAGFGPIAKLFARVGSEAADSTVGTNLAKPSADWRQSVVSFFRNKEAPVPALITNILSGTDNLGKPFQMTPEVLAQMFLPFIVNDVREAYLNNEGQNKLLAAPTAAASLVGIGTQSYPQNLTQLRDSAAQQGVMVGDKLVKANDYQSATPEVRAAIDKTDTIVKYQQENPSPYKQDKAAVIGPIDQKEAGYEQAFKNNQLSKPLPEYWTDLGNERRGAMAALSNQFKDMFTGFDKTRFDKGVADYYSMAEDPKYKNLDGSVDFDKLESARQDYIKTLKPDEQQWLDEALQVSRESKSPAHQKYLKYIDERKQAGYFDVKADDPDRAKKLVELDRKNPLQDALNWYWKGGTVDTNRVPGLNSPEAISLAMQMDPKRPATYAGLTRPVNQTPQTYQAWQDYSTKIQNYYTKTVPAYQDQIAQDMFGVKYAQLPDRASRERVVSNILTQVRRGSPELEAVLQFFGDTADGNGDYVVSAEAAPYLRQLVQKYGSQPVKAVNSSGRPSRFLVRE